MTGAETMRARLGIEDAEDAEKRRHNACMGTLRAELRRLQDACPHVVFVPSSGDSRYRERCRDCGRGGHEATNIHAEHADRSGHATVVGSA